MERAARAVLAVKTSITNRIRAVIDALPPFIRDARWFNWPLFFVWFKGRQVRTAMEFKSLAASMSDAQFREVYRNVKTLADDRETDTNDEAMAFAISRLEEGTLLDVGCGRRLFLNNLGRGVGCDLLGGDVLALAERLPFLDKSFDVVTCFHTLEHTRDLPRAIAELRRVAKKQLIVIVPRQKRLRYTFDLHLQFFETPEALADAMGVPGEIRQFSHDLVYISRP